MVWLSLALTNLVQAETPKSIEEFNSLEPKWPLMENATFTLEGRYSIFSPTRLRMEKCKLDFVFAGNFSNPAGESKVIQIRGHLERRDGDQIFVVKELLPQPSDVSTFRSRRGKVPSNQPEEWYKLAKWGAHRAEYYRDDELKKEAVIAFTQGVVAEHRNLSPVRADDLRQLASKLSSWNADPRLQLEYHHEACRMDYNTALKNQDNGDLAVLAEIRNRLPGSDQPLTPADEPLRAKYEAAPLAEFKEANDETRKKFARILYVDILKSRILREASPDGKNGFSIAKRIETQLPEFGTLAPEFRDKELAYHLGRVGSLTRKEMAALLAQLEPLNQPKYLEELKRRWMAETEKQIDPTSAIRWVELGDNYAEFLNDIPAAIRCYKQAYKLSPDTQVISDWLTEQGLHHHQGDWYAKGEVPAEPSDPLTAAIRAGVVQPGMNEDQVKSALGVEPTRRTRIATSGHVQEWWLFEDHGLSVQFTRRRRPEPALVTRVMRLGAKSSPTKVEPVKPVGTEGF
ncbi:MAG: hypothetical protein U0929_05325 [Planctomycetaceae bacterium]